MSTDSNEPLEVAITHLNESNFVSVPLHMIRIGRNFDKKKLDEFRKPIQEAIKEKLRFKNTYCFLQFLDDDAICCILMTNFSHLKDFMVPIFDYLSSQMLIVETKEPDDLYREYLLSALILYIDQTMLRDPSTIIKDIAVHIRFTECNETFANCFAQHMIKLIDTYEKKKKAAESIQQQAENHTVKSPKFVVCWTKPLSLDKYFSIIPNSEIMFEREAQHRRSLTRMINREAGFRKHFLSCLFSRVELFIGFSLRYPQVVGKTKPRHHIFNLLHKEILQGFNIKDDADRAYVLELYGIIYSECYASSNHYTTVEAAYEYVKPTLKLMSSDYLEQQKQDQSILPNNDNSVPTDVVLSDIDKHIYDHWINVVVPALEPTISGELTLEKYRHIRKKLAILIRGNDSLHSLTETDIIIKTACLVLRCCSVHVCVRSYVFIKVFEKFKNTSNIELLEIVIRNIINNELYDIYRSLKDVVGARDNPNPEIIKGVPENIGLKHSPLPTLGTSNQSSGFVDIPEILRQGGKVTIIISGE